MSGPGAEPSPPLPELREGLLDEATLEALLRDLGACTRLLSVRLKAAAGVRAERTVTTLERAAEALRRGEARAVQVRYAWEGRHWCDTLMRGEDGRVRLVRLCLEDVVPPAS